MISLYRTVQPVHLFMGGVSALSGRLQSKVYDFWFILILIIKIVKLDTKDSQNIPMGYIVYEFNDEDGFGVVNPGQVHLVVALLVIYRHFIDREVKTISVLKILLEPFLDVQQRMLVNC